MLSKLEINDIKRYWFLVPSLGLLGPKNIGIPNGEAAKPEKSTQLDLTLNQKLESRNWKAILLDQSSKEQPHVIAHAFHMQNDPVNFPRNEFCSHKTFRSLITQDNSWVFKHRVHRSRRFWAPLPHFHWRMCNCV